MARCCCNAHLSPPAAVRLALEAGFADQPRFNREFRAFAGVAPEAYRRNLPASANHLPVPVPVPVPLPLPLPRPVAAARG